MPLARKQIELLVKRAKEEAKRAEYTEESSVIKLVLDEYGKCYDIDKEQLIEILKKDPYIYQ